MNPPKNMEALAKVLTMVGATAAFFLGVFQFLATQNAQGETRRIEATRPFLDRQLKLYTEATQAAATLATSTKDEELTSAKEKFWSLYWGELALVEDKRVEAAMVNFGKALEKRLAVNELKILSLELAHACRDSLGESWGVKQWRNPHSETRR
ncbi:hypothetical protein K2O51_33625 (plasmid) [Cupriavidus pinatubonensis]|uniref:hypothetical protein n=1 Tax=Cupriavidus pinatubonensis TaxID=248026 RepID=UPI001C73AC3F|nr:hypothetical protein [Cupriavidus pinatubonensis]QYY33787.1 hypothetical protein K2O51_33625 [Cupriavidus pinatubonensis]